MITKAEQRIIQRECDLIIDHCTQALDNCVILSAIIPEWQSAMPEMIAENLRKALFQTKIFREYNERRNVECKHAK